MKKKKRRKDEKRKKEAGEEEEGSGNTHQLVGESWEPRLRIWSRLGGTNHVKNELDLMAARLWHLYELATEETKPGRAKEEEDTAVVVVAADCDTVSGGFERSRETT